MAQIQIAGKRRAVWRLNPNVSRLAKEAGLMLFFTAVGRAALPDGASPFAAAAAAAAWTGVFPTGATIGCFIGAALGGSWQALAASSLTVALCWIYRLLLGELKKQYAMLMVFLGNVFVLIVTVPETLLDVTAGLLNCAASALLYYIFALGLETAGQLRARKLLSEDEMLSICLLFSCAVLGISDISLYGISPAAALVCAATLLFASLGGAGTGAACATALGAMLCVGGRKEYMIYVCAQGLVCGCVYRLGSLAVAFSALLISAALAFYSRGGLEPFAASAIGAGIFLMLPRAFTSEVGRFINAEMQRERNRKEYLTRLRNVTAQRLEDFSQVFAEMGGIFSQPVERAAPQAWNIDALMPVCGGCPAFNRCWCDKGRLYDAMEQIVRGERPPFFIERCMRLDRLSALSGELIWARLREAELCSRLNEATVLAGRQLTGVAAVVDSISERLEKDIRFDDALEAKLMRKFDIAGCSAKNVTAQYSGGRLTVSVEGRTCMRQCSGAALRVVNEESRKKMRLAGRECDSGCRFVFEQAQNTEVSASISQLSQSGDCGDSAIAESLGQGRFLMAISDGMGSGTAAHNESAAAIALLKRLYSAGVDREVAVEAVNRLLLLRGENDMFSTLDVCCIDLVEGRAELCKLGAPPSYWLCADGVRMLCAETLPAGVVERAQPQVYSFDVKVDDWIIMFSDGAHDAISDPVQAVRKFACGKPELTAKCLLKLASENGADDDATVIAAHIVSG